MQWGPCTCGLSDVPLTSLLPSSHLIRPLHTHAQVPTVPCQGGWGPLIQRLSLPAQPGRPSHPRSPGKQEVGHEDRRRPLPRDAARLRLHPWSRLTCGRRGPALRSWPGASGAAAEVRGAVSRGLPQLSGAAGLGPAQVTSGAQRSAPGPAGRALESCSSTQSRHASGAQAAHL